MTNIIRFPKVHQESPGRRQQEMPKPAAAPPGAKGNRFIAGLFAAVWIVTVLLWPLLQWVLAYDVLFHLIRMMYYWSTPGVHARWTFLLHFGAMSGLTYYVAFGKPKGF
jgi:hypothetical protein